MLINSKVLHTLLITIVCVYNHIQSTSIIDSWITCLIKFLVRLDAHSNGGGNVDLLGIIIPICLFLLKKDFHALRHNCYIGLASILALCPSMVKRAFDRGFMFITADGNNINVDDIDIRIKYYAPNFTYFPLALSIITLSFLRSFNLIIVHVALIDPTRKIVRFSIDSSIMACYLYSSWRDVCVQGHVSEVTCY